MKSDKFSFWLIYIATVTCEFIVHVWTALFLWAWFVVSVFNLPELRFWSMAGFILTTRFFTIGIKKLDEVKDEDSEEKLKNSFVRLLACLIILGVGYLYHLCAQNY